MTSKAPINPGTQKVEVAILGAGFGGLCMAIKLREAGNDDFVILEKGEDVGGTWYFNTYPGAACDVQSHLYSYSFATRPDWTHRYADWRQIHNYMLDVTDRYGLRPFVHFGQEVCEAHYNDDTGRWTLRTRRGDTIDCRYFVLASGPLHVPHIPAIKGLDKFKGKVMHSSQWDHGYNLHGKSVVSIGTGGSAIQYCPEIAPDVKQLYVFQRTPAWVIPRDTRSYWKLEQKAFEKFPLLRKLHRARLYWTNESRVWPIIHPSLARFFQGIAEAFIKLQVKDPLTRAQLTPDYTIGCKRVLISNKWYPMFNRRNVELVTAGIREVREHSIVTADGVERPADCIILGTGFIVDPRIYMKDFPLTGAGGRSLIDDWKDLATSHYGVFTAGYPNLFQLVGPNTGLGHNSIVFMIEAQAKLILQAMDLVKAKSADCIDVKPEAQEAFNARVQAGFAGTVWTTGCKGWYQSAEGGNFVLWPFSTWKFWLETRKLKSDDYHVVKCAGVTKQKVPGKHGKAIA
ncbi:MAG: monooxygenase, flavin-binding family [Moraxellaceae bacterium]|jgi:cation diffusion facilitator CzcD-associated flavoprotein CzcO|nr:monooxygenase, flavin-binding family [Moraxellaceae bacterium]